LLLKQEEGCGKQLVCLWEPDPSESNFAESKDKINEPKTNKIIQIRMDRVRVERIVLACEAGIVVRARN